MVTDYGIIIPIYGHILVELKTCTGSQSKPLGNIRFVIRPLI